MHTYAYVCIRMHMYLCMRVCMRMHRYAYVCIHSCICVCIRMHTYANVLHTRICIPMLSLCTWSGSERGLVLRPQMLPLQRLSKSHLQRYNNAQGFRKSDDCTRAFREHWCVCVFKGFVQTVLSVQGFGAYVL